MSAHPARAGSVSAQLFAEFLGTVLSESTYSTDELRQTILDAAMRIAMQRASRKFRWPWLGFENDWDSFGQPYNIRIGPKSLSVTVAESKWIFDEVRKIAKNALAALEEIK